MRFKRPKTSLTRADYIIWSVLAIAFVIFLIVRSCTMEPREGASQPRTPTLNSAARPADSVAALAVAQRALDRFVQRVRDDHYPPYGEVQFATFTVEPSVDPDAMTARFAHGRVSVDAVIRYRLSGTSNTVKGTVRITIVRRQGHWTVDGAPGLNTDLWTHQQVREAVSPHVVVIGATKWGARLPGLSHQADRAMHAVSKVWGTYPDRRVLVVLPGSPRLMDSLIGSKDAHAQPAVASWSRGLQSGGTRVTLNSQVFFDQPRLGQQILLRHELTHVVQNMLRPDAPPLWLVEGFADYVAYQGTGVSTSVVAAELIHRVAVGGVPDKLPGDHRFNFSISEQERRTAYESGWSMCRLIADTYGEQRLVSFYQAAATADGTHAQQLDQAARTVLGVSGDNLIAQWQTWLREQR